MSYRVIDLSKGFVAVISGEDFRRVNRHKWYVTHSKGKGRCQGKPYARASINGKKVYLHRFITGAEPHLQVDHRNRQTLDCRRTNLECITPVENLKRQRRYRKKP